MVITIQRNKERQRTDWLAWLDEGVKKEKCLYFASRSLGTDSLDLSINETLSHERMKIYDSFSHSFQIHHIFQTEFLVYFAEMMPKMSLISLQ